MTSYFDPYEADRPLLLKCSCGRVHTVSEHQAEATAEVAAAELRQRSQGLDFEAYSNQFVEATLIKAIFPQDAVRRRFFESSGQGHRHGRYIQRVAHCQPSSHGAR